MQTVDSTLMRAQNSSLILRLIWNQREISRAEIARRTGLSRSTVSAIVNQLLQKGLVSERGTGSSSGGRRPIMLRFCDDAFALVGVDLGATHVGVALTNLRGEIQSWKMQHHPMQTDPQGTLALIERLIQDCLHDSRMQTDRLVGIGVGVPSPVDLRETTDYLSPLILPDWRGHDVRKTLQDSFGVAVYIDNDANMGALAELWWGAGRTGGDLAFIKLGTGVGAGLIIKGEIYRGNIGMAGEIGHTVIDPSDARSLRGLRGCLSAFVGSQQLLQRVQEKHAQYPACPLSGNADSLETLVQAALDGDRLACDVIQEAGQSLGIAVANLLNLLNPKQVVLGGTLTKVGELLTEPVRQAVRERTLWESIADSKILVSELGELNIAQGAATQVLKKALHDHNLFPVGEPALLAQPR